MKNKKMNLFLKSDKKKVIRGDENNSNSIFYLNVSWIMIQMIILFN